MRVAVALPSLEAAAAQRRSIDAMLVQLCDMGHEVEGFAEHDRCDERLAFPTFHYLRLPERHAAKPFEVALYPFGRDATPYQGVFALMNQFPGVVWMLDPVLHHLAVGGIALMEDWGAYRKFLDRSYGDQGAVVAQTVALNWGTGALYRRYDLLQSMLSTHGSVLAAWPALADRVSARLDGRAVGVVPLGAENVARTPAEADEFDGDDIAIMTVNESYATTAVRAAAEILDRCPDARVRLCLSEPIYKAEGVKVARHRGIEDRITWELTTSPEQLRQVMDESSVLVWLAEELQGGHRLLLLDGMAAGKVTFVPRCSLYEDLPAGVVAKLDLGRTLAAVLAATLRQLSDDTDLRSSLVDGARSFAAGRASVAQATQELAKQLQAAADAPSPSPLPVSGATWSAVRSEMMRASLPGGAAPPTVRLVGDVVDDLAAPFGAVSDPGLER